jgi:hypothetical protein
MSKVKSTVKHKAVFGFTLMVMGTMIGTSSSAFAQDLVVKREALPTATANLHMAPSGPTLTDHSKNMNTGAYLYSGKRIVKPAEVSYKAPIKSVKGERKARITIVKREALPVSDPFLRR